MGLSPAFLHVLRFSSMNPDSFFGSEVRILEFGLGLLVIVGIFGLVWVGVFCFVFCWQLQLNI